jgi:hypothetical protein
MVHDCICSGVPAIPLWSIRTPGMKTHPVPLPPNAFSATGGPSIYQNIRSYFGFVTKTTLQQVTGQSMPFLSPVLVTRSTTFPPVPLSKFKCSTHKHIGGVTQTLPNRYSVTCSVTMLTKGILSCDFIRVNSNHPIEVPSGQVAAKQSQLAQSGYFIQSMTVHPNSPATWIITIAPIPLNPPQQSVFTLALHPNPQTPIPDDRHSKSA